MHTFQPSLIPAAKSSREEKLTYVVAPKHNVFKDQISLHNSKVSMPFQPFYVECLDETFPTFQAELHFLSYCFCPCNNTDHVFWPSVTSSRSIILFILHCWCLTDTWHVLYTQYRFPAEVMLHCIWYRLVSADVQLDTLRKQTCCLVSIHSYCGGWGGVCLPWSVVKDLKIILL